jgi:hypothetical protein
MSHTLGLPSIDDFLLFHHRPRLTPRYVRPVSRRGWCVVCRKRNVANPSGKVEYTQLEAHFFSPSPSQKPSTQIIEQLGGLKLTWLQAVHRALDFPIVSYLGYVVAWQPNDDAKLLTADSQVLGRLFQLNYETRRTVLKVEA